MQALWLKSTFKCDECELGAKRKSMSKIHQNCVLNLRISSRSHVFLTLPFWEGVDIRQSYGSTPQTDQEPINVSQKENVVVSFHWSCCFIKAIGKESVWIEKKKYVDPKLACNSMQFVQLNWTKHRSTTQNNAHGTTLLVHFPLGQESFGLSVHCQTELQAQAR